MKIIVFDLPAVSGGALSVLYEFYNEFKFDKENEYIFVVSLPNIEEASNIKVLRFPWVKRSWGHRLFFDYFVSQRLIKKYGANRVISLQNLLIPRTSEHQTVLIHNALPFTKHKFSFFEDRLLWIYQNILGSKIKKTIKKADHIIVQTNWMKKWCVENLKVNNENVEVRKPEISSNMIKDFASPKNKQLIFFYPANGAIYKNHKIIVKAGLDLKKAGYTNYKVIFTLQGNESKKIEQLYLTCRKNKLPFEFQGKLSQKEVFELYSKSVLLFPSYIETVGLPLLEAKLSDSPILAADCEYSHEILDGYEKVAFFDPFKVEDLVQKLKAKL